MLKIQKIHGMEGVRIAYDLAWCIEKLWGFDQYIIQHP
jgi:hypothetical protein